MRSVDQGLTDGCAVVTRDLPMGAVLVMVVIVAAGSIKVDISRLTIQQTKSN